MNRTPKAFGAVRFTFDMISILPLRATRGLVRRTCERLSSSLRSSSLDHRRCDLCDGSRGGRFCFRFGIPSPDDEYNSYVVPVCSRLRQPEGPLAEYFART